MTSHIFMPWSSLQLGDKPLSKSSPFLPFSSSYRDKSPPTNLITTGTRRPKTCETHQLHQLQDAGNRRKVLYVELDPVEAVVGLGLSGRPGGRGTARWRRMALVNRNDRFRHHGY